MAGGLLARGDIYIGTFNADGTFRGFFKDAVNGVTMQLTPGEAEEITRESRMRDTAGQALSSVSVPGPWTITFATDDMGNKRVLAMALSGEDEDISESAGAFTDEEVVAAHDLWVPIGPHRNLDANTPPTVSDSGDTTTYTEDTDYVIDYRNGRIRALSAGSITDGEDLLVDGTTLEVTGDRILGATKQTVKTRLFFDGKNLDGDTPFNGEIYEVNLRASGGVDFITDEFATAEMEGTLVTPSGKNHPFYFENLTFAE